jgi:trehalose 6-phosphate phosphatase
MQPGDLARVAPVSSCAYFLDADGTLLDIMPRPEDVVADDGLRTLLAELTGAARGALALISGRTINDIDRIFAPLVFPVSGLHGAEIRFPDRSRSGPNDGAMDGVRRPLADFMAAHPGLRRTKARRSRCISGRRRNSAMRSWSFSGSWRNKAVLRCK